jgi:protein TonB
VLKIKPTEMTQPVKIEDPEEIDEDEGEEFGVEGGVPGGVAGGVPEGVVGGVLGGPPPPPPPPPEIKAEEPTVVAQVVLEQQRLSGNKLIIPDDEVKLQIKREAKTRVITTVKMCLSAGGNVTRLTFLKSSGYPSYDQKIKQEMQQWKYSPFQVNGKPVPVCTSVTFIYNQKN